MSRALRGGAIALAILLCHSLCACGAKTPYQSPDSSALNCAMEIVADAPVYGYLALVQDKSLLFNEDKDAFLMYARAGHCRW